VALLLGIALFPLGLIAILQTAATLKNGRELAESSLLSRTEYAVEEEKRVLLSAQEAAETFGYLSYGIEDDARCSELARAFVQRRPQYLALATVDTDGVLRCGSAGIGMDFTGVPDFEVFLEDPRPTFTVNPTGIVSDSPVIFVSVPVFRNTGLDRIATLSFPQSTILRLMGSETAEQAAFSVALFDAYGTVLGSDQVVSEISGELPEDRALAGFVGGGPQTFTQIARNGERRHFAVLPVLGETLYAISSWPPGDATAGLGAEQFLPIAFPFIMWFVSLLVAILGLHMLVLHPLYRLKRRMVAFRDGRRDPGLDAITDDAPSEIQELAATFGSLAARVRADEKRAEQSLEEKTVLLKEVYHRVKNNLQLIASIMNMQIRSTRSAEAKYALRRVQNRVMGLATIHKSLYTEPSMQRVRADVMIRELINQFVSLSKEPGREVRVEAELSPVTLYPDQAVPVSLFLSEAVANAMKHMSATDSGVWLRVTLGTESDGRVRLQVENPYREPDTEAEADTPDDPDALLRSDGSGLGKGLMQAFVTQLDGDCRIEPGTETYRVTLRFSPGGAAEANLEVSAEL